MKILFLGDKCEYIKSAIKSGKDTAFFTCDKITQGEVRDFDFIVSFGYRHIIKPDIIDLFKNKIINLHISYLPYNRGADPNLWSFLEDTPKGVTIHQVSYGLDNGDILLKKELDFGERETLASSYEILIKEISYLFINNADKIFNGEITAEAQTGAGSFHYKADKALYMPLLEKKGYDTPVRNLIGKGLLTKDKYRIYIDKSGGGFEKNAILRNFTELESYEIERVLDWRNSENIRLNSFNKHIITDNEHLNFIKSLRQKNDKIYNMAYIDNAPAGVIGLNIIDGKNSADISYYKGSDNYLGRMKGMGVLLLNLACRQAKSLGIKRVYTRVYKDNTASVKSMEKCAFQKVSEEKDIFIFAKDL